jgi:hypothetical protein
LAAEFRSAANLGESVVWPLILLEKTAFSTYNLWVSRTRVQIPKTSPNNPRRAKPFSRGLADLQRDDARGNPFVVPGLKRASLTVPKLNQCN